MSYIVYIHENLQKKPKETVPECTSKRAHCLAQ